ncbi:hypothetical protein C3B47_06315 [Flavobacterium columnare]|uniref:lipopolysaccharide biosynthesis protein n=1 Tax=Flavobacterium columnare TaxID=996 RepID=UPI000D1A9B7A|nr:lipopolysaccharide biosynthesis protein [Flavobacterium columnare]MBF6652507.1 hypothetical protein [Flavobacterium columnare]MBF6655521.1 hypothetical protein [Flavobacterium columnare]MBF6658376.1 hypothetical protein [Flavobacterium columnare]PTD14816.1 hypothetical protein C6N29_10390 [Flavobacterium columnare]
MDKILSFSKIKKFLPNFLIIISQGFIALIIVLIDFVFSKKLNLVEFGAWKQVFIFLNIFIPVVALGIAEGFKYYIAKSEHTKEYLDNLFFFLLAICLVLFLVLSCLHLLHFFQIIDLGIYHKVSFLFPVAFLSFILSLSLRYYYINDNNVITHTRIIISYIPFTLLFLGGFYFFFNFLKGYYLYYGVGVYTLLFGLPIYTLLNKLNFKLSLVRINRNKLLQMFKQGFPLYLATFIGLLSLNFDKILVSTYENKEVFALFAAGAIEIPVFAMISAAFSNNDYPKLVELIDEGKVDQARLKWVETAKNVSFLTFPIILLMMVFAKQIILTLYSQNFAASVYYFKTYLLIGLFRNNFYGALMAASGESRKIGYFSVVLLFVNCIITSLFYWLFGLKAVVFGAVIATFIYSLIVLFYEGTLKYYFYDFILNKLVFLLIMFIFAAYFFI